ncbi:MAG: hypothetical protein RLY86_2907 [Pseudomonadota bacterium]|jgi:hypothetical protein
MRGLCCLVLAMMALWSWPAAADDAAALVKLLTGGFSTARQAAQAPDQPQSETLRITPVWPHRTDGPWLYVERALAVAPDRPVSQQIWQVKFQPHKGGTEIRFHDLPDPAAVVGAWRDPAKLRAVAPERLTRREGCDLILQRRREFYFAGGSTGMDCPAGDGPTGGGQGGDGRAESVTVQSTVAAEGLTWWERGYDAGGRQVTGAAESGLVFDKVAIGDVPITP